MNEDAPLPDAVIDLPECRIREPELLWTPDGSKLIVMYEVEVPASWLDQHSMDLAFVGMLLGFAIASRTLWLILRRPRSPGLQYCRHCNHALTAAQSQNRCPECGRDLSKGRSVVIGETTRVRMLRAWPLLAPAAIMLVLGAGHFRDCASRGGPLSSERWPSQSISEWFPAWKIYRPSEPTFSCVRFDIWQVPPHGTAWSQTPQLTTTDRVMRLDDIIRSMALSRTGEWIAWIRDFGNADRNDIRIFELRDGQTRDAWVADAGFANVRPRGSTDDGERLLYTIIETTAAKSPAAAPQGVLITVSLHSIDAATGSSDTTLGEISWHETQTQWPNATPRLPDIVAATCTLRDGRQAWAIASRKTVMDPDDSPPLRSLWVSIDGIVRQFGPGCRSLWPGSVTARFGWPTSSSECELTPDGMFQFTPADRVSILSGECADPEPQRIWLPRFTDMPVSEPIGTLDELIVDVKIPSDPAEGADERSGRVAQIGGNPPLRNESSPVVSPKGDRVAIAFRGANGSGHQVWIWPLRPTERDAGTADPLD